MSTATIALLEFLTKLTLEGLKYFALDELRVKRNIPVGDIRKARKPDLLCLCLREMMDSDVPYNLDELYSVYQLKFSRR